MKQPARKLLVYEALSALNQRFEQTLLDIERVKELGVLRRALPQELGVILEETRAWTNFELIEAMHERELNDWTRFGRLRRRFEKRYEDPKDVLIKAQRLEERARQSRTKARRSTKHP